MIVSYDGRNFSGWQKQPNADSIQKHVEDAIEVILKEKVNCVASGRTDAGVSAYYQPVHFETVCKIDENKFLRSMNGILTEDIRVLSVVGSDIHARFSAKKKTYLYKMYVSNIDLPLYKDALRVPTNLDFKAMKKFIHMLKGTHDFAGFRASGSETETSVRSIFDVLLVKRGLYLYFTITGNGFLYKMVRNIVGTMLKIGEGKLALSEIKHDLFSNFKSTNTAKAEFLYLLNVKYG